jgi:hypothetical protein
MTGRRLAALLVAVVTALAAAGCGLPSRTQPTVVEDAPRPGGLSDTQTDQQPGPDNATGAQDLVERYLRAAAGGNEDTQDRPKGFDNAADRVREFLTKDAKETWRPGQAKELKVVQAGVSPAVRTASPDTERVDVLLRPVGSLNSEGEIIPAADTKPFTVSYTVVSTTNGVARSGWRIANPTDGMLLSTVGLKNLYEARSLYFWDRGNTHLVPDLRYLARSIPEEQRPNELVSWLKGGPSGWLAPATNGVPDIIQVKDRVSVGSQPNSRLQVNLSAKANSAPDDVKRFFVQLQWSLTPTGGTVDLRIENQRIDDLPVNDYLRYNPAYLAGDQDPRAFCVLGGKVRPIAGNGAETQILSSQENSNVLRAALTSDQSLALVRADGPGRQRLWLGSWDQSDRGGAHVIPTDFTAVTMSRPVWLANAGPRVLVAAGGVLYDVLYAERSGVVRRVDGVDAVSAFAPAPDGRRLAFVSRGRVYVAPLVIDQESRFISVGPAQEVPAGLTDLTDPTAVAWTREQTLIVAGRAAGKTVFVELGTDGALVQPLDLNNVGELTVTELAARPVVRKDDRVRTGSILFEAGGRALQTYSNSVNDIFLDPPAPSAPPGQPNGPTAPFFQDW